MNTLASCADDGEPREQTRKQGKVIWLYGLSGAGKTTLAEALEKKLQSDGYPTVLLDGDNLRSGLNKDLGFTRADRAENVRRVGQVAHLMADAGLVVIVALVSPFAEDRDSVRELFDKGKFAEVWVKTPIEVCTDRDPKGLYKKAADGSLPNLSGVGQEYEPPAHAELILDGTEEIAVNVAKIMDELL